MKARIFLAGGALFLSTVAIGSAKTWDVVMDSATRAGNLVLPAGNYNVKLDKAGNQAIFKSTDSGKEYKAPIKIEQAAKKFDQTAVESQKKGDQEVIQRVDLGGTNEMLEFGE